MRSGYARFVVRRSGQALLVVLLTYMLTFFIVSVLPGDPITNMLANPEMNFTEDEAAELIAYYGLDQPILIQLIGSLSRFVQGDLGVSLSTQLPINQTLAQAVPHTLALAATALAVAVLLAFLIAFGVHWLPARASRALRAFPTLFLSVPNFLIGLLLIQVFAFQLGAFRITDPNGAVATLFAAIALGIPVSAQIAQVFIASIDEVKSQSYIDVAKARGLTPLHVFFRHLFKPSSLPVVTVAALAAGELLGGSIITEAVFGRDGIGSVIQRAVMSQDLPVVQATVALSAVIFVVINLVTDLSYPALDPRLAEKVDKEGVLA